ncbi:MAG: iron-sulfur cluster assembly scaffold protein [Desulfopila sp.]|nr:iron-sulfur cluster assembly scaffold protein [Desulfopila sp.]
MTNNELDTFLDNLQDEILRDAHNAYGEKGYDRWLNPSYRHILDNPDCQAKLTGECGDSMEMYLKIDPHKQIVTEASYQTSGCASSSICGSIAAELVRGKPVMDVLDMRGEDILRELGKFPKDEEHCAHLAITTVKEAIHNYMRQTVKKTDKEPE